MIEAGQEEIKARQDKADAAAKCPHVQLKQAINSHRVATINSVRLDLEQMIKKGTKTFCRSLISKHRAFERN
jgi:hypothetical protein